MPKHFFKLLRHREIEKKIYVYFLERCIYIDILNEKVS